MRTSAPGFADKCGQLCGQVRAVVGHPDINSKNMTTERPITLQEHAMRFGTYMGLFWIFKFVFLPAGFAVPFLQALFILLTCFVPVLGFIYTRRYRELYCEGRLSFSRAFGFTLFMYLFASLLTAAAHYVYFRFIDGGYLINSYIERLEMAKAALSEDMASSVDRLIEGIGVISSLSPLELTLQLLSQNFFYGLLLAFPTALFAMKCKKKNSNN